MKKEQFKNIRERMGLSQAKFAKILGYDTGLTILRKEKGQAAITKQDEIILNFLAAPPKKKK
jgi:DNA-binding transcriptional regulator YiaG